MAPGPDNTSELRQALEDLRARERVASAQRAEELQQLTYALSHELREPLRMISNYSQLLDHRYQSALDDAGKEFLHYIVDAAQRMDRLLADLLAYSNQLGPLQQPPAQVDSEAALEGVLLSLERPIRESGAQITHDPLPQVMFDFSHLSRVFQHLIANAITFRGEQPLRIHISAAETDGACTFAVRDNGAGIDPRYQEQIFGIFRRLHGREIPGNGMGLAVCKRIVEQHGGKIWVESEAGRGSVFRFTVPL